MSTWIPESNEEKRSCMVVRSCVSQEKPALNPWLRCSECCVFEEGHGMSVDDVLKEVTWDRYHIDGTVLYG